MRRFFFAMAMLAAQLVLPAAESAQPERILVIPKAGQEGGLAALHASERVHLRRSYPRFGNVQVLQLPPGASAPAVVAKYQRSPLVAVAELDGLMQAAAIPNDPSFFLLWGLHNTGQSGYTPDADIDAPEAWDIRKTATNVLIAVVDSGVRYNHEDLNTNLWRNPGEIQGNMIDDDNNGYVDDYYGLDAITGAGDPFDPFGHGSHLTGTIGARGNNGVGVAGVAWEARIMTCRFLASSGGTFSDLLECLDYALTNGARIINASFVATNHSESVSNAFRTLQQSNVIVVAASGNSRTNIDVMPFYPVAYPFTNIVAVLATDFHNELYNLSNVGATNVDLGAPGVSIYSSWHVANNGYVNMAGTSMAGAFVSGAVALLWEQFPNDPYWKIIDRVLAGTDPLPALAGKCVTGGRLNLRNSLAPRPVLNIARGPMPADLQISLRQGAPSQQYALECSADFSGWTSISTNSTTRDGRGTFNLTIDSGAPTRFYRVTEVQ